MLDFTQKLLKAKVLSLGEYPQKLSVPGGQVGGFLGFGAKSKFWDRIEKLRRFTDSGSQNFSDQHEGSTGWEYEMMLAFVNGKFFYSSPTTIRNYTQVSSRHSLKINSKMDNQTIVDEVILDDKVVGSLRYFTENEKKKRSDAISNQEYQVGFVCHFHTHPKMRQSGEERDFYHFFSLQDMQSLISSSVPMMGLVGDKLWLVGKTKEFLTVIQEGKHVYELGRDLGIVTRAEKDGNEQMLSVAGEFFHKYKLAGYVGEFGGRLKRVGYDFTSQRL